MEDLDERKGMKNKDQNEGTQVEKETTVECKEKGRPSEENDGEGKPIEEIKQDDDPTKKERR